MRREATVAVVIPAFNEERSVGTVVRAIPQWVDSVIVVDNGSTDRTAEVARSVGARVVHEPRRGYGSACLAGIAALDGPDVVVFLDGDFSDHPDEMPLLVDPIALGEADLVIGSRTLGRLEPGALTPQARFGNWLACALIRLLWSRRHTDLGPFRAIRHTSLRRLGMADRDYGWTVEMQVKAAQRDLRVREAAVSYRRRIGKSKISGTVRGVIGAGVKILGTIFVHALNRRASARQGHPDRLIIFTRYPKPGRTKTRLIPALGPAGAAKLQRAMTEHVLAWARELRCRHPVSIEVHFAGGRMSRVRRWLGSDIAFHSQGLGDLGQRMHRAFRDAFATGARRAIIVGTDCPGITADLVQRAFQLLDRNDVALGPATDGGYYLIGLRKLVPELFRDIAWGTERVRQQTLEAARRAGASLALLDLLSDVDRPEDLPVWERSCGGRWSPRPVRRISVVIPTLNEGEHIAAALASARTAGDVEVIVVDGGSRDGTAEIARSHGATVLTSPPGRARQMNTGAAAATGDVLLFLHADTRLPASFGDHVRSALIVPGALAGAFMMRTDAPSLAMRLVELGINWRSRLLRMPYGDQALFVWADVLRRLGGFPEIPIMEDYELVRRLRRRGGVVIARAAVVTSPRRWRRLGVLRTTLVNQVATLAYRMGVSPAAIACWYQRATRSK